MFSLFLDESRQHMPVCDKIISSFVRKKLSSAKAYMSLGILRCCDISSFCGWCFPGVSPAGRRLGKNFYSS